MHCDVAQESDVAALRDAALKEFGAAHLIFNNAGVGGGATIGTPKKVWDWVMGVNLDGVVNGINAFVPLFLEQNEGHVVNTASEAGLVGVRGHGSLHREQVRRRGHLRIPLSRTGRDRQERPRLGALPELRAHAYQ